MLIIFCQDISSATDNKLLCITDKNNVVLCFIFPQGEHFVDLCTSVYFCSYCVCHLDNVLLYSIMHITGSVSQNNFG